MAKETLKVGGDNKSTEPVDEVTEQKTEEAITDDDILDTAGPLALLLVQKNIISRVEAIGCKE